MTVSDPAIKVVPLTTIELPANLDALASVNRIIEDTLQGPFDKYLFKAQLVVEELLANICSYAYDGKTGTALFACGVVNFDGRPAIMIELTDHGKPYDPFANAKEPDLNASVEDRQVGGLGLHLVKEIATHYVYMRIDSRNQTQIIICLDDAQA